MMDSITLSWFAGLSNFYSVLSVLICFCIMVVFILRLNGDNFMSSSATHYNTPEEQPMTKLHNPFSIKVSESKMTSLKDGLNLEVSVKSMSRVEIFWGVNIQTFQREIHKPFTDIHKRLIDKQMFDEKYLHRLNLGVIGVTDRPCELYSKCPETVTESSLGSPPRQLYPIVVISVIENLETIREFHSVAAQFTIIHLKDSVCQLDSHIVYQFVKTNQNSLLSLQPIFLSSSEQDFSSNTTPSETVSSHSSSATNTCLKCTEEEHSQNISRDTACSCESTKAPDESNVRTALNSELKKSNSAISRNSNESGVIDSEKINENGDGNCENVEDASIKGDVDDERYLGLDETNTCIICQSAVIYYTLLPCRHACVCVSCVRLVDRCPLCRCYIDAFFRLYEQDYSQELFFSESDSHSNIVPAATIWEALNQRLNEMFGLA